jgi:hypothetical protein
MYSSKFEESKRELLEFLSKFVEVRAMDRWAMHMG